MATGLVGEFGGADLSPTEIDRRAEWQLRCIVSLLAIPGADAEAERSMIDSFVVPVLLAEPDSEKSRR